ncbi:hypothetical protein Y032_0008g374 [Ancylostoma ceylanicum]|uniref:Uncharacterized protein n=1 Tax=Ancylostoma ceylanicum TaxID=53326 RepID=A0A016VLK5_9BILA|nr:hypothetical protein Y032_0008g374 [Ancylostoma ceylanicum]
MYSGNLARREQVNRNGREEDLNEPIAKHYHAPFFLTMVHTREARIDECVQSEFGKSHIIQDTRDRNV